MQELSAVHSLPGISHCIRLHCGLGPCRISFLSTTLERRFLRRRTNCAPADSNALVAWRARGNIAILKSPRPTLRIQGEHEMTECSSTSELNAFVNGDLLIAQHDAVALHVSQCESCQRRLDSISTCPLLESYSDSVAKRAEVELRSGQTTNDAWNEAIAERLSRGIQQQLASGGDTESELPPEIPGCKIDGVLGRGGMGTVYRAWQTRLERWVAVKTLKSASALSKQATIRFAREVAAVGRLHHPGIVTAYDANEYNGVHYLLMEYVDGENLSQVLSRVGPFRIPDASEIIRQIAEALQYGHIHNLIHRDVKPSNIMLTTDGRVKLLDLGLARFQTPRGGADDDMTQVGQMMGTVDYMAPEQGEHGTVDIRADVFGLGATWFKLLTGVAPLQTLESVSTMQKIAALASGRLPSVGEHRDGLPKALTSIVDKMLAHKASDRFATPGDVAAVVEDFCVGHALRQLIRSPGDDESASDEKAETISPLGADVSTSELIPPEKTAFADKSNTTSNLSDNPLSSVQQASVGNRGWRATMLSMLGLVILLVAGVTFRFATDGGEIRINSFDSDIEVEVLHNGQPSAVVSASQLNNYTWYRSGDYEIRLRGDADRIQISGNRFTITRGSQNVVTIERIEQPAIANTNGVSNSPTPNSITDPSVRPPSAVDGEIARAREFAEHLVSRHVTVDVNFDLVGHNGPVGSCSQLPLPDRPFRIYKVVFNEGSTIQDVQYVANAGVEVEAVSFGKVSSHLVDEGLSLIADGLPSMHTLGVPVLDESGVTADRYVPSISKMKNLVMLTTNLAPAPNSQETQAATLRWCKVIADLPQVRFAAIENPVSAQGLRMLAKSDSITTVAIDASRLSDNDLKTFATFPNLINIVILRPALVTQSGLEHLAAVPGLQNLTFDQSPPPLKPKLAELARNHPQIEVNFSRPSGEIIPIHGDNPKDDNATSLASTEWSEPTYLHIPGLEDLVGHPAISGDGNTIVFESNCDRGVGGLDLWITQRPSADDSFSVATNLGTAVNFAGVDASPCLSTDGLTLIFASKRGRHDKNSDLWISRRDSVNAPFGKAEWMDAGINSDSNATDPRLSFDGLSLFFVSKRRGGVGGSDIWVAHRPSTNDRFSAPENMGDRINSEYTDRFPFLSPDSLELWFSSNRPGGLGERDLWVARRNSPEDQFGTPQHIETGLNSVFQEDSPSMTADGRTLFFESNRPVLPGGHHGLEHIWMSSRQR